MVPHFSGVSASCDAEKFRRGGSSLSRREEGLGCGGEFEIPCETRKKQEIYCEYILMMVFRISILDMRAKRRKNRACG